MRYDVIGKRYSYIDFVVINGEMYGINKLRVRDL